MASLIVDILFRVLESHGVQKIVCSPGSRNAELLLAAARNENLEKFVVVDERVAAYTALGMAQVSRQPVLLVCTSGSAVLNYAPALSEAYYQGLPLIVLSADRPAEWIDQDDSQTIRQFEVLANIVKRSYDINTDNIGHDYIWYVERTVNEGMLSALSGKPGPVHFNIHLAGCVRNDRLLNRESRKVEYIAGGGKISESDLEKLAEYACNKKILIVAGFALPDSRLQKTFQKIVLLPNIAIMAETLSNLHLRPEDYMIDSVLCHMTEDQKEEFKPNLVISIGGALVSRMLKDFLRTRQPAQHWSINNSDNLVDCFKSLTIKIDASPAAFLSGLTWKIRKLQEKNPNLICDYGKRWQRLKEKCLQINTDFVSAASWSDLKAFNIVLENVPAKANLFLSNGTSVRYAQILSHSIPHATFGNRGVSGIEGSLSAAIGGSLIYRGLTLLLIGDMSFMYDIGSLNSRLAGKRLRVIVFSNGGGDIFRFISMTSQLEERERFFCVNPDIPIKAMVEAYDWKYLEASDEIEFKSKLKEFFLPSEKPMLLNVITTGGERNSDILKTFLNIKNS